MSGIRKSPRFFTTVTRYRRAAGSYMPDGRWHQGTQTSATITASVQPASGRDLMRLPEGLRTGDVVTIIADADVLRTADERTGLIADHIVHDEEEYEVVEVQNFRMPQMEHLEALARRVDREGVESPA